MIPLRALNPRRFSEPVILYLTAEALRRQLQSGVTGEGVAWSGFCRMADVAKAQATRRERHAADQLADFLFGIGLMVMGSKRAPLYLAHARDNLFA